MGELVPGRREFLHERGEAVLWKGELVVPGRRVVVEFVVCLLVRGLEGRWSRGSSVEDGSGQHSPWSRVNERIHDGKTHETWGLMFRWGEIETIVQFMVQGMCSDWVSRYQSKQRGLMVGICHRVSLGEEDQNWMKKWEKMKQSRGGEWMRVRAE
jgi:hypothetical protein